MGMAVWGGIAARGLRLVAGAAWAGSQAERVDAPATPAAVFRRKSRLGMSAIDHLQQLWRPAHLAYGNASPPGLAVNNLLYMGCAGDILVAL